MLAAAACQCVLMLSACRESSCSGVREAAKAGTWYPGSKGKLEAGIDGYLAQAEVPDLPGKVVGIVSPHAGYAYSGPAAAHGYKTLKPGDYDVVVVLAPSHYARFDGASILDVDHYSTPLGRIALDRKACDALVKGPHFSVVRSAHSQEHSLELQLPFLQRRLGQFLLVPIVIGHLTPEQMRAVAGALKAQMSGRRVLYVASSDFTHYGRQFGYVPFATDVKNRLKKLDMGAVERIAAKDFDGFLDYRQRTGATICGWQPIGTLLAIAEENWEPKLLCYYTSGHLTGEWDSSVSYVSLVFTVPRDGAQRPPAVNEKTPPSAAALQGQAQTDKDALSEAEQTVLLRLARDTLDGYVRHGRRPQVDERKYALSPRLKETCGVFVTLKKHGRLRGCIGHIMGRMPLYRGVVENAINSAANDPRFPPVRSEELGDIEVEVSVLTPFRPVASAQDFVPGKHGIYIKKGRRSAVFLPQVATEQGWDRAETLRHLCRKAGLASDEWQRPGMEFYVCTGQAFGEGKH